MKWPTLQRLVILCGTFATTAAFGQTIYTWTGVANGTNLATAGNWTTNGVDPATTLPNGNNGLGDGFQDRAQWDGRTTTNLVLIYPPPSAWPNTGFGSLGVNLVMTANQTNDVQITTSVPTSAGMGINHVTNHSPNAAFTMGDNSANNWLVIGRPAGAIHHYVNNSTAPAIINPSVKWQAGGGAGYTYAFRGTGDWIVNSYLMTDSGAFSPSPVTVNGPGTVFWYGGKSGGYNPNSPLGTVTINGGVLILKSDDLFPGLANQAISNNATLIFDAASESEVLSGVISGAGLLIVTNGTLTLSGASIYTGNTLLKGGTLIANGAENPGVSGPLGVGGLISFEGGTLGFSVNNVYDYSSRFSTAAGQSYSFDTGGRNVTFTNTLGSSGGTLAKLGAGTLTLSGTNSYSGVTTVSAGKLVFQGPKTGTGNITVADGAALGITDSGTQITSVTLTVGTSSSATLEFDNVTNTTTAPLAAVTISSPGTTTINLNSGTFNIGSSYPLLAWISGSAPAVSLGSVSGALGNLTTNGNTIQFNVTSLTLVWSGTNSGNWTDPNNWTRAGIPITYFDPSPALFDDTAAGTTSVIVDALVQPASVIVNNSSKTYSITSSGGNNIGGSASLTKVGNGSLTLSGGANTYTGVTTVSGSTLSVGVLANGGAASDIGQSSSSAGNLVLNGGVLRYTGAGASSDRSFTLSTSGGTINASGSGALVLNSAGALGYSDSGPRSLTLTGTDLNDNTLAAPLANNGGTTTLTKSGAGKWVLTGTNTYSGITTISAGTLQVGAGGGSGALGSGSVVNDGTLIFNRTGSLTVSGVVSGNGSVTVQGGGTVILPANNTYAGGSTIASGSTLQVGSGGGTGSLNANGTIANDGTFIFNSTVQPPDIFGVISGTGNLIKRGSGTLKILGVNTYTGNTTIEAGTLQICTGNIGASASPQIAVFTNATLTMVRQDNGVFTYAGNIVGAGRVLKELNAANAGDVTFTGINTYTGGTYIAGGGIVLGDNINPGFGSIVGNVIFTNSTIENNVNRFITFNRPDNYTFSGHIYSTNTGFAGTRGSVVQSGSGITTLTGTNNYPDGTTINAGTLRINGTNSGGGTVTVNVGGTLGGTGRIVGNVNVTAGGILAPGASVGTLTIVSNLTIAGDLAIEVNKSLGQSNDVVVVGGNLNNTGVGTLTVANLGPALAVGDKFTLFSKPVAGGGAITVIGGGVTWVNNLAVDGSISITAVTPVTNALIWTGSNNGSWDLTTSNNWTLGGGVTVFTNGFPTVFDDTAPGTTTVTINSPVQPSSLTFSNSLLTYSLASSGGNNIGGSGNLTKLGSGTLTLSGGANTYTGVTTVSNGTLIVNGTNAASSTIVYGGTLGGTGVVGTVTIQSGGTLSPGTSVGTLTINNALTNCGNVTIEVNKSLAQSNDFVVVTGTLTNSGTGSLTVSNLGPALAIGDKFTLFSKPVQNGSALTVTGAGATWVNNLAVDGSISIAGTTPPPTPTLNFTQSGNNLQFSWNTNLGSFTLQAQTNSLSVGLSNNWADYLGGGTSPVIVPIDPANGAVFFRLAPLGQGFIYDQQSTTNDTGGDLNSAGIDDEQPVGQSFVPSFSSVGFIRVFLSELGNPSGAGATVYLNLWADAIGTGTLLGSTASVFLPVGFLASTNFFFSPPVTVNPGTTYYFQPVTEVGSDRVNISLTMTGTAYTNGTVILSGVPIPGYDLWFREGIVAP